MSKNSNKKLIVISVIVVCTVMLSLFVSLVLSEEVLQEKEIALSVELVDGGGGFDLDGSSLTYGKLARGSSTTRSVTFTNEYDFDVVLYSEPYGNIAPFVIVESPIIVRGTEIKSIPVTLKSGVDDSLGNYEGYLKFIVKK